MQLARHLGMPLTDHFFDFVRVIVIGTPVLCVSPTLLLRRVVGALLPSGGAHYEGLLLAQRYSEARRESLTNSTQRSFASDLQEGNMRLVAEDHY